MPVWNNRRTATWLDVLILCEWVKSDTIRSVKTWIFLDVQDYWFAISSLNVEAIHKDRHRVCSFVLPHQNSLPAPQSTCKVQKPNKLAVQAKTQHVVHRWIIDFGSFFLLDCSTKWWNFIEKNGKIFQVLSFLGCPPWSKTVRRKTALEHIGFDRAQRVVRRSVHLVIRMIAVQCLGIHK